MHMQTHVLKRASGLSGSAESRRCLSTHKPFLFQPRSRSPTRFALRLSFSPRTFRFQLPHSYLFSVHVFKVKHKIVCLNALKIRSPDSRGGRQPQVNTRSFGSETELLLLAVIADDSASLLLRHLSCSETSDDHISKMTMVEFNFRLRKSLESDH